MKISFDVKLQIRDLYLFNLVQTYKGMQGIISLVIPAMIFAFGIYNCPNVDKWTSLMDIGIGLLLLIYVPVSLYLRSRKTILHDPVLSRPLHYEVSEEGIFVSQEEESATLEWEQVYRMKAKGERILIYTNRIHAYIIPKRELNGQEAAFIEIARKKLPKYRFKA